MNRRERRRRGLPALVICFSAGVAVGWLLHGGFGTGGAKPSSPSTAVEPLPVVQPAAAEDRPAATSGSDPGIAAVPARNPIEELRRRKLMLPIAEAEIDAMEGDFVERRGTRVHEAVDILAPRNTPIRAVEGGTIARLFLSKLGGTTIYQFDSAKRFCYYYAHLQRYASGLREGQAVSAGEVIGYVGTSGNAPKDTPHLHFAIFELTPERRWWEGRPLDPYLIFR
jgi:murein DD-endopeptidase MepM/ murein hydrolase activator NlpD